MKKQVRWMLIGALTSLGALVVTAQDTTSGRHRTGYDSRPASEPNL